MAADYGKMIEKAAEDLDGSFTSADVEQKIEDMGYKMVPSRIKICHYLGCSPHYEKVGRLPVITEFGYVHKMTMFRKVQLDQVFL